MKKSLSVVLLIFLMFVVIRLVGLTYGFYNTRIVGNTNDYSVSIDSKYLLVEYFDGTSVMNFEGDYLFPGNTAEKTFTVKNTGDDDTTYNILIDNVVNEFERVQDLRYDLYINDELVFEDGAINNNVVQYLYFGKNIEAGNEDNIRFVFTYAETNEIQNVDMDKGISFRFNISNDFFSSVSNDSNSVTFASREANLNSYRIYGNSLLDESTSELVSTGDKTVNLLDQENITLSSGYYSDGSDGVGGSLIEKDSTSYMVIEEEIPVDTSTTYTVSSNLYIYSVWLFSEASGISSEVGSIKKVANSSSSTSLTFTTTEDTHYIRISLIKSTTTTDTNDFKWIQLENSSSATEYEPYGKYKVPVTVRGKNLLKISPSGILSTYNNGFVLTRTESNNRGPQMPIDIKQGSKVTISFNLIEYSSEGEDRVRWVFFDKDGNSVHGNVWYFSSANDATREFTASTDLVYVQFYFIYSGTVAGDYYTLDNVMVRTDGDDNYEPYVEPQTANIYLDQPLRKNGENADYIDFKRQILVRYDDDNNVIETPIKLPSFKTYSGTTILEVNTELESSSISIETLQ